VVSWAASVPYGPADLAVAQHLLPPRASPMRVLRFRPSTSCVLGTTNLYAALDVASCKVITTLTTTSFGASSGSPASPALP
jgi:hypothetical protein